MMNELTEYSKIMDEISNYPKDIYDELLFLIKKKKGLIPYLTIDVNIKIDNHKDIRKFNPADRSFYIKNTLYKIFLSLIDDESRKKLLYLDSLEGEIKDKIEENNAVIVDRFGAYFISDSYTRSQSLMYLSSRLKILGKVPIIARGEEIGYILYKQVVGTEYPDLNTKYSRFYHENRDYLNLLHDCYKEKENIMRGHYLLKDETEENERLLHLIACALGYFQNELKTREEDETVKFYERLEKEKRLIYNKDKEVL